MKTITLSAKPTARELLHKLSRAPREVKEQFVNEIVELIDRQQPVTFVFRPQFFDLEAAEAKKPYAYSAYLPHDLHDAVVEDIVGGPNYWQWNAFPVTRRGEQLGRMQLVNRIFHAEQLGLLQLLLDALGVS